jgi:cell division septation protein DedD
VTATSVSITNLRRRAEQRPDARIALAVTAGALVLVGAVGALLALAPRLTPRPRPVITTRVANPAPAAPVDAVLPVAMPEPTTVPVSTPVPNALVATPARAQRTVAPAAPAGPSYTLAVGTFLAEDRAREAADALAAQTGRRVSVQDLGAGLWRLHLGRFATAADAEQAANRLLARGAVSEAVLEPLPE